MPVSSDGVLEAVFDPSWAAVRLIVDGGMWSAPVDAITIERTVPGQATTPLRGVHRRRVVGGSYVGSDHEMPLDSDVTYRVLGLVDGETVAASLVTVQTSGAAWGIWLKAPGKPDLTCLCEGRSIGDVESETIGGAYQIAGGGGTVAQTLAHWSGVHSDRVQLVVATRSRQELARLKTLLAAARVLLVQTGEPQELDSGWYFVSRATRANPGGFVDFAERWVTLDLQRTGVPAGEGSGIAGVTWASLVETHETWAHVLAAHDTWFDVLKAGV